MRVSPGLSSFVADTARVAESLRPLMEFAKEKVLILNEEIESRIVKMHEDNTSSGACITSLQFDMPSSILISGDHSGTNSVWLDLGRLSIGCGIGLLSYVVIIANKLHLVTFSNGFGLKVALPEQVPFGLNIKASPSISAAYDMLRGIARVCSGDMYHLAYLGNRRSDTMFTAAGWSSCDS
ncbi:Sugar transporter ERD6-like protein 5 [Hordeum vulgare]|nr:Sugar transporter ERD6-like protein 5 [Hordeum vulgare]